MPQTIQIPSVGAVQFPDSMTDDAIESAIREKIIPQAQHEAKSAKLRAEQTALEATPDPSLGAAYMEEISTPFIDIPKPAVREEDSAMTKFGKGVTQSVAGAAEGLETPLGASVLAASLLPGVGKYVAKAAGLGFGAAGLKRGLTELYEGIKAGDAAAAGRGAGNVIAGGLAFKSSLPGAKPGAKPGAVPEAAVADSRPMVGDVPAVDRAVIEAMRPTPTEALDTPEALRRPNELQISEAPAATPPEGALTADPALSNRAPREMRLEVAEGVRAALQRYALSKARQAERGTSGKLDTSGETFSGQEATPAFLQDADFRLANRADAPEPTKVPPDVTEHTPLRDVEEIVRDRLAKRDFVDAVVALGQTKPEFSAKVLSDLLDVDATKVPLSAAERTIFEETWQAAYERALTKDKPTLIDKLEALKKPLEPGVGAFPFPEIAKAVWNTALDLAIVAIKAGSSLRGAIDSAISHIRKNAAGFDEEAVRSHLEDLLTKELPRDEQAQPREVAPSTPAQPASAPTFTSIKNATVDAERAQRGLPPAEPVARRSFGAAWDAAQRAIEADPNYQSDLISELARKPRALTDTEDAALLQRQIELQNFYDKAQREVISTAESGDRAAQVEARARLGVLSDQLLELYNAGKRAGTETARGLAARRMLADERFKLPSMVTEKRAVNGGRPLTDPEIAGLKDLRAKITASQEAIDKYANTDPDRPPTRLDENLLKLQAANERYKAEFAREIEKDQMAQRNLFLRSADLWTKWRRFQLLSGPRTLGKLVAAAGLRMVTAPIKEAVGAGIGKVFPALEDKARVEGGFSMNAEVRAVVDFWTKGMQDAADTLRTGKSNLDAVYGRHFYGPDHPILDFWGRLHGALKAPVKRAYFARAFAKGIEFDAAHGIDITDPLVQTRNAVRAFKEADRAVFMEDNRFVDAFNGYLKQVERPSKETGVTPASAKLATTAIRTELPIVRIPTNIVAQALEHAFGTITGSWKLAAAYRKGIENLSEAEADLILRQLKSGSVGASLLLLGFFQPEHVGGYFQRGQKRDKYDVKYGGARIFDTDIPAAAMHEPSLEVLQLGATIRRVADAKLRKHDKEAQGIPAGTVAGLLGLVEETPFIRDMFDVEKAFDPQSRQAFFGELAKSLVVPQAVSQLAERGVPFTGGYGGDVDASGEPIKRAPQGIVEHIESGVPGLREDLARKQERKPRNPIKPPRVNKQAQ